MLKPEARSVFTSSPTFNLNEYREVARKPSKFIEMLDKMQIDKAVLVTYVSPEVIGLSEEVISFISKYCRDYPDRLIPFSSPNPVNENAAEKLEEIVTKYGIKGVKIHPVHQLFYPNAYRKEEGGLQTMRNFYAKAEDLGIPMMVHTGTSIFLGARIKYGNPIYLDDIAVDFPKLKIVMSHGGRPIWMKEAFYLVRRHRNVYIDISGIPPKNLLKYFPRLEEIADKAVFGSDWPSPGVINIKSNILEFLKLSMSNEAKKKILKETALKILTL